MSNQKIKLKLNQELDGVTALKPENEIENLTFLNLHYVLLRYEHLKSVQKMHFQLEFKNHCESQNCLFFKIIIFF